MLADDFGNAINVFGEPGFPKLFLGNDGFARVALSSKDVEKARSYTMGDAIMAGEPQRNGGTGHA